MLETPLSRFLIPEKKEEEVKPMKPSTGVNVCHHQVTLNRSGEISALTDGGYVHLVQAGHITAEECRDRK